MDFANFVQNYLNQQTEGDPSFMVSDEALAFVDLMRKDDMDRRASSVSQATSADERGEPTNEQVADKHVQDAHTTDGDKADQSILFQEDGEDTTPAESTSEVALGIEPLLASSSQSEDAQLFSPPDESGEESAATSPVQESHDDASAIDLFFEHGYDSEPSAAASEQYLEAEQSSPESHEYELAEAQQAESEADEFDFQQPDHQPGEQLNAEASQPSAESSDESTQENAATSEEHSQAESLDLFSQESVSVATNEALQSEGVHVTDIPNLRGETTFIVPEGMPDFNQMIQTFDRDYRPPDLPVGDLEIPQIEDSEAIGLGDLQNTSEFAESMIASMSNSILDTERSAP